MIILCRITFLETRGIPLALRMKKNGAYLLLVLLSLPSIAWADNVGAITLAEGKIRLLRGVHLYSAKEGVQLQESDIIETMDNSQAQVELIDGTILNLDASSKMYLANYRASQGKLSGSAEIALIQGWLKFFSKKSPINLQFIITTPSFRVVVQQASGILHIAGDANDFFLESGNAKVAGLDEKGKLGQAVELKSDEFITRKQGKTFTSAPRPPKSFVEMLPKQYLDALPPRIGRLKNRVVEPKKERKVTYPDIESWLKSNPDIRQGFVKRFRPRIADHAFRKALEANLKEHNEWRRVLYPEKYEKKTPPAAAPPN